MSIRQKYQADPMELFSVYVRQGYYSGMDPDRMLEILTDIRPKLSQAHQIEINSVINKIKKWRNAKQK